MPRFSSVQAATFWNLYTSSDVEPEYNNQTMVFVQSTTPTGWVRDSTYDESTIRIVTGASVSSGGDLNFSSTMTSSFSVPYSATFPFISSSTTITEAQTAAHTHSATNTWRPSAAAVVFPVSGTGPVGMYDAPGTAPTGALTTYASNATASGHSHQSSFPAPITTTVNMAVKYVDVLHATKTPV